MSTIPSGFTRLLAIVVLASLAAACGGEDERSTAKHDAKAKSSVRVKTGKHQEETSAEAGKEDDGIAHAVPVGKSAASVDLNYEIASKPVVGQPFEITLVFVPRIAADSVEMEASGMPGLVIASGSKASLGRVSAGERYPAKVLVQGAEPGLYYVSVTARLASRIQSDTRTFSVPVVVAGPPAAKTGATER